MKGPGSLRAESDIERGYPAKGTFRASAPKRPCFYIPRPLGPLVAPGSRVPGTASRALLAILVAAIVVASAGPSSAGQDRPAVKRPPGWVDSHVYHHYNDLTTELQDLQSANSDVMALSSIGSSVRSRSLWCARIEDPSAGGEGKLALYLDGEHHGNEQLGGELAILLIHHLVEDRSDALVQQVLSQSVVYITPMINPDGNTRNQRDNLDGVDLNRNYPYNFTSGGGHGTSPASEPEVRANVGFMTGANLSLYMTFHTGTVVLVYPWGDTMDPCPDAAMYERFREIATAAGITYGPSGSTIYLANGDSEDFAYGTRGVPAFTFEVDGQQARWISTREDIATRLADEEAVVMQLLAAAPLMTASLNATPVEIPSSVRAGDKTTLEVALDNPSYEAANDTTVTVELRRDGEVVRTSSTTVDVPAEGTAKALVGVTFPEAGKYEVLVRLEFRRLQVANATNATAVLADRTVEVRGGLFGGGGGGAVIALVLVVVLAAGGYVVLRRRGVLRQTRAPKPKRKDA